MAEAYFYHLTRQPLEAALPMLLERARARGWRVLVRGTSEERMRWLDEKLWLGGEESFLPHGLAGGPRDAEQPVLLTTAPEGAANAAEVLMAVDGATVAPGEAGDFDRVCLVFDGNDPAAVEAAREQWRRLTAAGLPARYWSQEGGRWEEKAASNLPAG
jgi:DNA polymerase-3 subunit chi